VSVPLDPIKSAAGRIGAMTTLSRHDPRELTRNANKAFARKFETQVDPLGQLDPEERQRRAAYALKAHMQRLAMASAKVRAARKRVST
jgi:hypothetical protein